LQLACGLFCGGVGSAVAPFQSNVLWDRNRYGNAVDNPMHLE
jgi:hypothetical protein